MGEAIQEKRQQLNAVSIKAKEIKEKLILNAETDEKAELYAKMSINEIIVQFFYRTNKDYEFKTFRTWLKDGFVVNKGETAFLLWGRKKQEIKKPNGETKTEELEFFPITYVFSNNQVQPFQNGK